MTEHLLGLYQSLRCDRPYELTNGALVMMNPDGLFWTCDLADSDLLPPQGPSRTAFVLKNLVGIAHD